MALLRIILEYIFSLKHVDMITESYISGSRMFQKALDLLRKAL